jgi:hypothetical protein
VLGAFLASFAMLHKLDLFSDKFLVLTSIVIGVLTNATFKS